MLTILTITQVADNSSKRKLLPLLMKNHHDFQNTHILVCTQLIHYTLTPACTTVYWEKRALHIAYGLML